MSTVNDGSVVWQVCRYDEAQTLGGKSLSQIQGNIDGLKINCYIGSIHVNQKKTQWQIPIPSGENRNNCGYIISDGSYAYNWTGSETQTTSYSMSNLNQINGIITLPKTPLVSYPFFGGNRDVSFYIEYEIIALH